MNVSAILIARSALLLGLLCPQERGEVRPARELWIFLSPGDPDLSAPCRSIGRIQREFRPVSLRACLLAEDWTWMKKATELQVKNIQALGQLIGPDFGLRLVDEEGLARARELGIEKLPAFVLFDHKTKRAHVVHGCGANVAELFRCE